MQRQHRRAFPFPRLAFLPLHLAHIALFVNQQTKTV
jgi:hypothetical protein